MSRQAKGRDRTRDRSPQEVDPLSWFTGPLVPPTFAALFAVYGVIVTVTARHHSSNLVIQLLAVALCASACVLVHLATRPKRPPIGWTLATVSLLIALCGCQLSASDYAGGGLPVEQWWGPGAVSLTILSLSPYLSIRRLVVLGLAATAMLGVIGSVTLSPVSARWSMSGIIVLLITTPLIATAAASVFNVTVVRTTQRLLGEREERGGGAEDVTAPADRGALAHLTARATPFLEHLAETGRVTATDRTIAGQLARRVRDDLVLQANASWLDAVAAGRQVVVMDPERRADAMNDAQKAALAGLIDAILDTPDAGSHSVLVELRGQENGATAVGVSVDLHLPEGRRTMHLAPYYLTLKTAFEGLSWSEGRLLDMRFEVPPGD